MLGSMIHLDANGSTALLPEVLEAMLPWLREGHANPSGAYASARKARAAMETARGQIAEWIGAEVTADLRYRNSNLIKQPFSTW